MARVAIVDYGMGNLFSVAHACEHVGLDAAVTPDAGVIAAADAVILPGVGAFGDAMDNLRALGLVDVLKGVAASGRPLFGICLGLQLLLARSEEFGEHEGLGVVDGDVVSLGTPREGDRELKVPQVAWNRVYRAPRGDGSDPWADTVLGATPDGTHFYFVHSLVARPSDPEVTVAVTRYGDTEFCSALKCGNVFATQFHPERSGPDGLRVYEELAASVAG